MEDKSERIATLESSNKRLKDDLNTLTTDYLKLIEKSSPPAPGDRAAAPETKENLEAETAPEKEESIRTLLGQFVTNLAGKPEHAVTLAVMSEFGSAENCAAAFSLRDELLEGCLKVLNKLMSEPAGVEGETVREENPAPEAVEESAPHRGQNALEGGEELKKEDMLERVSEERESPPAEGSGEKDKSWNSWSKRAPAHSYNLNATDILQIGARENRFGGSAAVPAKGWKSPPRAGERGRMRQVFNQYTRKATEFFDPALQYGGKSM